MVSVSYDSQVQEYINTHKDDSMSEEEILDLASDYLLTRMEDIFKAHSDAKVIKKNYNEILQEIDFEIASSTDLISKLKERRLLNVQMLSLLESSTNEVIIKQDLCRYFLKTKDFMRAKLVYTPEIEIKEYIDLFTETMSMEDGKLQILLPLFELVKLAGVSNVDKLVLWYMELKDKQFDVAYDEIICDFDFNEFAEMPFMKRFIEWFRVYITELLTSFSIIFPKLNDPHEQYLKWFTNKQIHKFLDIIKQELGKVRDATQLHAVSLQLMYCGLYFKQYNLDFRQDLTNFIQSRIISLVTDKMVTASEYFIDQVERINGLHPKNPIAANLINFIVSEKVEHYKSLFEQGNVFEPSATPSTPVAIRFAESPPQLLIDFPLLATCLNHMLEGFNILYIFPLAMIHQQVGTVVNNEILRMAKKANEIYRNNKDYLLGDHVYCLLYALRYEYIPYILKALVQGIYGDLCRDDYFVEAQAKFKISTTEIFELLNVDRKKRQNAQSDQLGQERQTDNAPKQTVHEEPLTLDEKSPSANEQPETHSHQSDLAENQDKQENPTPDNKEILLRGQFAQVQRAKSMRRLNSTASSENEHESGQ